MAANAFLRLRAEEEEHKREREESLAVQNRFADNQKKEAKEENSSDESSPNVYETAKRRTRFNMQNQEASSVVDEQQ